MHNNAYCTGRSYGLSFAIRLLVMIHFDTVTWSWSISLQFPLASWNGGSPVRNKQATIAEWAQVSYFILHFPTFWIAVLNDLVVNLNRCKFYVLMGLYPIGILFYIYSFFGFVNTVKSKLKSIKWNVHGISLLKGAKPILICHTVMLNYVFLLIYFLYTHTNLPRQIWR